MSGGALDYVYGKLQSALPDIRVRAVSPLHKAFARHLQDVCDALHDLEWVYSADYGPDGADESIKKALGKNADKAQMEVIREELKELVEEAKKILEARK